jgi:hypothetical protein
MSQAVRKQCLALSGCWERKWERLRSTVGKGLKQWLPSIDPSGSLQHDEGPLLLALGHRQEHPLAHDARVLGMVRHTKAIACMLYLKK